MNIHKHFHLHCSEPNLCEPANSPATATRDPVLMRLCNLFKFIVTDWRGRLNGRLLGLLMKIVSDFPKLGDGEIKCNVA